MVGKRKLEQGSDRVTRSSSKRRSALGGEGNTTDKGANDLSGKLVVAPGEHTVGEMASGDDKIIRESNYLLQIFPEEVWIMILDNCDHVQLQTTSNASPFFRNLLRDKRVIFFFPIVWFIMAEQYHAKFKTDMSFNEARPDAMVTKCCGRYPNPDHRRTPCETCGKLHGIKWYSGILRLRLVCKFWSRVIDHVFQSLDSNYECTDDFWSSDRVGHWVTYRFTQVHQNPQEFRQHFERTHGDAQGTNRNPFLNRRISITYDVRENMLELPDFLSQVTELLFTYGHQLFYCSLKILRYPSLQNTYQMMSLYFDLMPNLKVFSIDHSHYYRTITSDQIDDLRTEIQLDPLPSLANLQYLLVKRLPSLIFNELIRRNSHVVKIKIGKCGLRHRNSAIYSTPLPNLNKLSLKLYEDAEIRNLESSALTTDWPLRRFSLNLSNFSNVNLRSIFALLENKWSNTLTHLIINILGIERAHMSRILGQCKSGVLNLPNLQRLDLLMPGFFSLDFILPMRNNLEILDVTIAFAGEINEFENKELIADAEWNAEIAFLIARDPLDSNIWTLFPNLKYVRLNKQNGDSRIKLCSHTRREWTMNNQN